jgi:adenylate kinase
MRIVILGPQGSGKGTQAKKISDYLNIPHISTGDIFRENVKNQTELGKRIKKYLDAGEMMPDKLTDDLVEDRLKKDDCKDGFILDGYPRNPYQAQALDNMTEIDLALEITIPDDEALKRISGRLTCRECGEIYSVSQDKVSEGSKCRRCGGELYIREDDTEEAIKNRLNIYHSQTEPVARFYENRDVLVSIDGMPLPDEIFGNIKKILDERKQD